MKFKDKRAKKNLQILHVLMWFAIFDIKLECDNKQKWIVPQLKEHFMSLISIEGQIHKRVTLKN
jgi:hypothetical protein